MPLLATFGEGGNWGKVGGSEEVPILLQVAELRPKPGPQAAAPGLGSCYPPALLSGKMRGSLPREEEGRE